jgi:hypothetical protein
MSNTYEGYGEASLTQLPLVIPPSLLNPLNRPPANKPDFIRIIDAKSTQKTDGTTMYHHITKIQIGEWKYCTDLNFPDIDDSIITKYTPMVRALKSQWPQTTIELLPLLMSRTGTPH